MAFDPDAYLASKSSPSGGFNPDAYLASKSQAVEAKKTSPGIISTAMNLPGVSSSPIMLGGKAQDVINTGFNKLGEKVATTMAEKGISLSPMRTTKVGPKTSAAAGTLVSMTPDLVSLSAAPVADVPVADKEAVPLARRALGYSKAALKTPLARRQATSAAAIALDEGIIPGSGSPEVMMNRAQTLQSKTGAALKQIRSSVGDQSINPVLDGLDSLKEDLLQGRKGGVWDEIQKKIDYAKETIAGLQTRGDKVNLNDVISAKRELGKTVNWLSDSLTQETSKKVLSQIEKSVGDILGKSGADLGKYNYLKKTYGASKSMIKALNNELSAQAGNATMSLPTHVIAAGQLASGRPMAALETAGAFELLKRRGAGIAASNLYKARVPTGAAMLLRRKKNGQ